MPFRKHSTSTRCCALFGCFLLFCGQATAADSICGCEHRFDLLMDFYNATGGPQWTKKERWGVVTGCRLGWSGVKCTSGDVSAIELYGNNLRGALPESWRNMTGLTSLVLHSNALHGTLPTWLVELPVLSTLNLGANQFTGTLPESWGAMPRLASLFLYVNSLSGTLPRSWSSMAHLVTLTMHVNSVEGTLPEEWSAMPNMTYLGLNGNRLEGTLPASWAKMAKLNSLSVFNNRLDGTLPSSWSAMSSVTVLSLQNNSFHGVLPPSWGMTMRVLAYISVASNRLSGTVPQSWWALPRLSSVDLNRNCLVGAVPETLWNRSSQLRVDFCGTRLRLPENRTSASVFVSRCRSTSADWPPYCWGSTHSASLGPTHTNLLTPSQVPIRTASSSAELIAPSTHRQSSPTTPTTTSIAIAASTSATLSALSGGDPSAGQVMLLVVASPCVCAAASDEQGGGLLPRRALVALSPVLLVGDDDSSVDPVVVIVANIGISTAVLALQVLVLIASPPPPPIVSQGCRVALLSPMSAVIRFPSLSITVALWLMPGVIWGASTLHTSASNRIGSTQVGVTAVAGGYVLIVAILLECVVFRKWIRHAHCGLRFQHFSMPAVKIFSPPLPVPLATVLCSREGVWGPPDRRAALGSPLVASFRPQFHRWIWAVGPVIGLVLVVLSTIQPTHSSRTSSCDAIQSVSIILLSCASLLFATLRPHRALLASAVCTLGYLQNAIVTLLGLLCRHGVLGPDVVLRAAAVASYVLLGGNIITLGMGIWERRILAAINVDHGATSLVRSRVRRDMNTIRRNAALQSLIEIICSAEANPSIRT